MIRDNRTIYTKNGRKFVTALYSCIWTNYSQLTGLAYTFLESVMKESLISLSFKIPEYHIDKIKIKTYQINSFLVNYYRKTFHFQANFICFFHIVTAVPWSTQTVKNISTKSMIWKLDSFKAPKSVKRIKIVV